MSRPTTDPTLTTIIVAALIWAALLGAASRFDRDPVNPRFDIARIIP